LVTTEAEEDSAAETEAADSTEALDQGKCTRQFAQIVSKIVKFLSSQLKANLYFARNVFKSIESSKNK
jgi:hypothetical protein